MPTLQAINSVADFSTIDGTFADLVIVNDEARTSGNTFYYDTAGGTADNGIVYSSSSTGVWRMMFSGAANIKWYGAVGDNSTDDSAAIQAALDNNPSIFIPASEQPYRCNVFAKGQKIEAEKTVYDGSTPRRSMLRSFTSDGYALHLGTHDSWDYVTVSDLWILGEDVSGGIQFDNNGENDSYAGRWVLNNVTFDRCTIAIHKPIGNIGNTFNSCCFHGGQYHYYAVSSYDPLMHTGCDTFNSCDFDGAALASIYVDQGYIGCGQHTFNECVFQGNPGFAFFINNYGWVAITPFTINNCWMEMNAYAGSVTINGNSYVPREFYFNSINQAIITGMGINSMYATTAVIELNNCYVSPSDITIDSTSKVTANGGFGGGLNLDILYLTPPKTTGAEGPTAGYVRMLPRTKVSQRLSANVIKAEPFNGADTWAFSGTSWNTAYRVKDGTSSDTCAQITVTPGNGNVHLDTLFDVPLDGTKYLVWIYDLKRVSGPVPTISVRNWGAGQTQDLQLDIEYDKWVTVCGYGIINVNNNPSAGFLVANNNSTTEDLTIRIGGISFLLFDNARDAYESLCTGELYIQNTFPITTTGTQSPAAASLAATWSVGDRCLNTAPVVGQPKSWICTVAGTPGTWVSEGNL